MLSGRNVAQLPALNASDARKSPVASYRVMNGLKPGGQSNPLTSVTVAVTRDPGIVTSISKQSMSPNVVSAPAHAAQPTPLFAVEKSLLISVSVHDVHSAMGVPSHTPAEHVLSLSQMSP